MTDVTVYGFPLSAYARTVRMTLEEKGVEYTLEPLEPHADELLDFQPFGKIPGFRHGDVVVHEALAIATYVDGVFEGPSLQPEDPIAKSRMMQWISVVNDYVYHDMIVALVLERIVAPMRGNAADEDKILAAMPRMEKEADVFDAALANQPFLAGDALSLADLFLAPVMFYVCMTPEGENLLSGRAHLAAWNQRMSECESFVATLPPLPEAAE